MTNEQREQARRAQAAYAEFLHWCVEYARRDKGLPPSTTADLEQGFAALHGLSGEKDFHLYQDFRAFLTDGKRAEFDKLRDDVCKAYHEQGIGAAVQRLEDEARYVEGFDFGTNSLEEIKQDIKQDIIQAVKEEHERTRQGQEEIKQGQGALLKGQAEQGEFIIGLGQIVNEIDRNTRPKRTPHGTYKVTQEDAARRLGRTVRTIKNWEAGEHTPKGYSRETRRTLETFTAWALSWQAEQKSKLNTKKAMRYADEHGYTFGASQR
jgi:ribosome-binding protein aMBF1 (putative translation factor)